MKLIERVKHLFTINRDSGGTEENETMICAQANRRCIYTKALPGQCDHCEFNRGQAKAMEE